MGWGTSILFWALVIVIVFAMFIGILVVRKRRRFEFPLLEIYNVGNGKIRTDVSRAGWFKKKKIFFNLLDIGGEEELRCKKGFRKIFNPSSIDYNEIDGKRGIIVKRKDDDPDVLVPLSRFAVSNEKLIASIAPADYRDVSTQILEERKNETLTWWEKNAPILMTMGVIVFTVIALILVFQFARGESSAWRDALLEMKTLQSSAP